MKKTVVLMLILAGLSLLLAIISKLGIVSNEFLNIERHTYISVAQLFLIAAIALKCCCPDCKCEKKPE